MVFKKDCFCEDYCRCSRYEPCVCDLMDRDPHCMWCCQHLTPEQEEVWREELKCQPFVIPREY